MYLQSSAKANGATANYPQGKPIAFWGSWGTGAMQRGSKGSPGTPEVQNGAKKAPKSIKNVSKIEELNDKRCLPLSHGGMSEAH